MIVSKSPLIVAHLIGIALSLGAVTIADLRLLPLLRGRTVESADVSFLVELKPFVTFGLALLWISGVGFLCHYYVYSPEALSNPKLHAKLFVVCMLTLNGIAVERYASPFLQSRIGFRLFDDVTLREQIRVIVVAVVSGVSWYTAILFGAVRELNFRYEGWVYIAGYAAVLLIVSVGLVAVRALASVRPGTLQAGATAGPM